MCVVDRRGTNEENEDRTKNERLKGKAVPSLSSKNESVDRMGKVVEKPVRLPYVVVGTPGSEALRKLLLERVFGPMDE